MTTSVTRPPLAARSGLITVYVLRAAFAVAWALAVVLAMPDLGPLLTALLVVYPVVDAGAVVAQSRTDGRTSPRLAETVNIVVSCAVAVAVGVASSFSIAAAVGVWGAWAALSGITQLVTALQRRHSGGQIPQILSGAISVVAGLSFLIQAMRGVDTVAGLGGYALLGGLFFLASAVRMTMLVRGATARG